MTSDLTTRFLNIQLFQSRGNLNPNMTYDDISVDQIRVRYLDDENCYVNLEEALMGELFSARRSWNRLQENQCSGQGVVFPRASEEEKERIRN